MVLPSRRTIFEALGAGTPEAFFVSDPPLGHLALFGLPGHEILKINLAPNRTPGSEPNPTGQQAQPDISPKSCTANTQDAGTLAGTNQTAIKKRMLVCVEYHNGIPFIQKFPLLYLIEFEPCTKSKPQGGFGKLQGGLTSFLTFEGFMSLTCNMLILLVFF